MRGIFISLLGLFLLGCGDDPRNDDDDVCPAAPTDPTSARVFVIQPRIAPDNFKSYLDYHNHLFKLVETHVSHCVVADHPNIVVFPENTGITAAFIGSRGQAARNATSALGAFLALGGQYTQPIEFYKNSWPNLPLPNQIEIAVTDTVWRAFHETNQSIAQQLGVWVISSTNISGRASTYNQQTSKSGKVQIFQDNPVYVEREVQVPYEVVIERPVENVIENRYYVDKEVEVPITHVTEVEVEVVKEVKKFIPVERKVEIDEFNRAYQEAMKKKEEGKAEPKEERFFDTCDRIDALIKEAESE